MAIPKHAHWRTDPVESSSIVKYVKRVFDIRMTLSTRTNGKHQSRDDSFRELKKDFDRRIHDLQAEAVEGSGAAVQESIDFLRNELEQRLSNLSKQIDESVEPGREAIRERPFSSVGAALGAGIIAGVLLGVFLGRKSKD
jgi:ElaB/YqjD/DUF883 family membrane-anchored ribosome-binding protein